MECLQAFFKLFKQALDDFKVTLRRGLNNHFPASNIDASLGDCLCQTKNVLLDYIETLSTQSKVLQSELVDTLELYLKDYKKSSLSLISKAQEQWD
jgi:hypothetical protein